MLTYYARFQPDRKDGGYVVTFPDLPYGVTQGDNLEEALEMARDLLIRVLSDLMKRNEPIPLPAARAARGRKPVTLPLLGTLKLRLYEEWRASELKKTELARRLGVPQSNLMRIVDLRHKGRLDAVERGFRAVGKELRVDVA
ncbi:MAG: type II toxin-antitoxin system HicB family antitoxin [Bryobacteraceae bacterium]